MIEKGQSFHFSRVDTYSLSTLSQVRTFCKERQNQPLHRIIFELEGVLFGPPIHLEDLSSCKPIESNVLLCRRLEAQGHKVIVATKRNAAHSALTKLFLEKHEIQYDELVFDQPAADFRIGNAGTAIDTLLGNLEEQLGLFPPELPTPVVVTLAGEKDSCIAPILQQHASDSEGDHI